ncbi:NUDIX domain-containing protein [uncultured Tateyamaria sp.]|uniref:NUDIX domain-containing protein n=1 Tax=uncultured Tateyamaria sp. TaxID=455651 RepID=UPI00263564C2|nr:NUDIX domain-containing protein [uncultured Tateyamaria sp.]
MDTLFFYGTLRHVPLLDCVLGRPGDVDVVADVLRGYAVLSSPDGLYPVLTPDADDEVHGVLVRGLGPEDIARLNYYEGGFDYDLEPVTLDSGAVSRVYVPGPSVSRVQSRWDFDAWEDRWAEMNLFAAQEVMAGYGRVSVADLAARFPRIRARAWSKVLARRGRHGQDVLNGRVDMTARTKAYSDFFTIEDMVLRHEIFGGGMSGPLRRAVFVSSDASIVLPYDPVRDRVLLVEQVRMGPIGRNDPVCWQMEPVAGLIDPGETPEEAARREGAEEAGLTFDRLEPAGECYASPGAATDFFHLFVGLCDLPDDATGIGGEEAEGENIRSHLMAFDDLLALADDRRVANTPLAMLTYWLAHHRARVQGARAPDVA